MSKLIYTERRLNLYKNRLTDHIREVYGLDCWLVKGFKVIDDGKLYIPLFIKDDEVCGLIEIRKEDETIKKIYLIDGSTDLQFESYKIKFV